MKSFLLIAQLVISGLLILSILSQDKGTGLSATFGGTGQLYSQRRGVDRLLFWITIILATIFVGISLASLFLLGPSGDTATAPAGGSSTPVESAPVKINAETDSGIKVDATAIPTKPSN